MAVALAVGDRAPDFALVGSDGVVYRLRDMVHQAPVVLAWYPRAYTPG